MGEACPGCCEHTVKLYSGDLVIFNGHSAVHGVARVLKEPPVEPRPGAPPLPPWASRFLGGGHRVSLQYRLMNREEFKKRVERDQAAYYQHVPEKRPRDEDAVGLGAYAAAAAAAAAAPQAGARSAAELEALEAQNYAAAVAASLQER